jgi:hypothetical protein
MDAVALILSMSMSEMVGLPLPPSHLRGQTSQLLQNCILVFVFHISYSVSPIIS